MRRSSALLGVLLTVSASAGEVPEKRVSFNSEERECSFLPPPGGYRVELGYGGGRDMSKALREARMDAQAKLLATVCLGRSDEECAAVGRQISPWGSDWSRKERLACAVVALPSEVADAPPTAIRDYQQGLRSLASSVAAAGVKRVGLDAVVVEGGCAAGDAGAVLAAELRNALVETGVTAPVEDAGEASQLRLQLTAAGQEVLINAWLSGAAGERALPGLRAPKEVLQVQEGACFNEAAVGLTRGQRQGSDGLSVYVEMETREGMLCEGERPGLRLRTSRAAEVQLFTLDGEGRAWMVWGGPINGELSLGEAMALPLPDALGDERLLAMAVPAGQSFGATAGWPGDCRASGHFSEELVPPGAALGSLSYHVERAGEGRCDPVTESVTVEELQSLADNYLNGPVCQ
jgi:hypothetical protein